MKDIYLYINLEYKVERFIGIPFTKPVVLERSIQKGASGSSPERSLSGNLEKKSRLRFLRLPFWLGFSPSLLANNGVLTCSKPPSIHSPITLGLMFYDSNKQLINLKQTCMPTHRSNNQNYDNIYITQESETTENEYF